MSNICFLDFEFNTVAAKNSKQPEVVSMGAIFVDEKGKTVKEFYSVVKPSKRTRVAERCLQYTGITRKEIKASPDFAKVTQDFLELVDKYDPGHFYVWGDSDARVVRASATFAHASIRIMHIADQFENYQLQVAKELKTSNKFSLERMAEICQYEYKHEFSALADAKCLAKVYFSFIQKQYDENRCQEYIQQYERNRFVGNYESKQRGMIKRKQHIRQMKRQLKNLPKGELAYKELKEQIASSKEKLKELEHFCKENEKQYRIYVRGKKA